MISAEEAREIVRNHTKETDKEQLEAIENIIVDSAKKGHIDVTVPMCLSKYDHDELKRNGFSVRKVSNLSYDRGESIEISW